MTNLGQDRTLAEGAALTTNELLRTRNAGHPRRRRIALYARTSSEDQRERETIKTQIEALRRFLAAAGDEVELVGEYFDDGVSGTVPMDQRPRGRAMLAACAAGLVDEVWATRPNRIGRKATHILNAVETIEACGAVVVGILDPMDTKFILTIKAAVAEEERRVFLENSHDGMNRAIAEGRYCGGVVPYGYQVEGRKQTARLVPDEDEIWNGKSAADIVRWMFSLSGERGWSCAQIADHFNLLHVPTHARIRDRGKRRRATIGIWRPSRIRMMLHLPVYRGVYTFRKRRADGQPTEPVSGPCARLVSDDLWSAAQETLKSKRLWNPADGRRQYLMRSVMRCGHCGYAYSGAPCHGPRNYYRCIGRTSYGGKLLVKCHGRGVKADVIEAIVKSDIERFLLEPGAILDELMAETMESSDAVNDANVAFIDGALSALDRRHRNTIDLAADGFISRDELSARVAAIEQERRDLEQRLQNETSRLPSVSHVAIPRDLLVELRARVAQGFPFEQWAELVGLLVKQVTVFSDEDGTPSLRLHIDYNFVSPEECVLPTSTDTG